MRNGGWSGEVPPAANGGRKGAGLLRARSSAAGAAPFSATGAAGGSATGGAAVFAAGAGCSSTGAGSAVSFSASGSATAVAVYVLDGCGAPPSRSTRLRTSSAVASSIELECVFFSVTPSSGNISTMVCDGTSSCLANSLMRILLINLTATLS